MSDTTSTASTMTVLAELVLTATRHNLPMPKYMTTSERSSQLCLTLNNRADLDAWHWAFGGGRLWECEPTEASPMVLVTNMHCGSLLGWSVNLQANVQPPLSAEVLSALGEAARSDAELVSADADTIKAETLAEPKADPWLRFLTVACPACKAAVGEECKGRSAQWSHIGRRNLSAPRLVEVQPDAEAVQPKPRVRMGDACGSEHTYRDACQYAGEVQP